MRYCKLLEISWNVNFRFKIQHVSRFIHLITYLYQKCLLITTDNFSSRGPGSVVCIATGYGLDGLGIESRWGRDFPHLSRPALGPDPASCKMGTGFFPGVKSGRGVMLTPHPLLVPWPRKGRVIPALPLWAVWPVQSLSACTRVHFTFTFTLRGHCVLWGTQNWPSDN